MFGDYLRSLAVLQQAQRRGVGRKTIDMLVECCQQARVKNLWACVSAFNTGALTFYDEQGFDRIGTLSDPVTEGEDEVLIRRRQ